MGKTVIPKYRLIIDGQTLLWRGRATYKRLEDYVMTYAESRKPGGCNAHISEGLGYIPYPKHAQIEYNNPGYPVIVVEWNAPMFMVW